MSSRQQLLKKLENLRELARRDSTNPHEALAAQRAADQLAQEHDLEETSTCPTCGHRSIKTEPKKMTTGSRPGPLVVTSQRQTSPLPLMPPRHLESETTKPPAALLGWVDSDEKKSKKHDYAFPLVHILYPSSK
jgi:hypothetical protein